MKNNRRIFLSIFWVLLGIGLCIAYFVTKLDEYWNSLGIAFIAVGIVQIMRWGRYMLNPEYREKMEVESKDERNRYLATKAWAWAGYLFVLICAIACIVLHILVQNTLSLVTSSGVCLLILLYWVSYLVLKRKY